MNLESAVLSTRSDGAEVMTFSIVLPKVIPSALEFERQSQRILNKCGLALMQHGLSSFDTAGEEIRTGGRTYTFKGQVTETYQAAFGPATILRHVYQHSGGEYRGAGPAGGVGTGEGIGAEGSFYQIRQTIIFLIHFLQLLFYAHQYHSRILIWSCPAQPDRAELGWAGPVRGGPGEGSGERISTGLRIR